MSQTQIADAIRKVTAYVQTEIDNGWRSADIDAHDVVEVLLAVADELDPPEPKTSNANQKLLEAARALLSAREDEMVTAEEWDRLRRAVEEASRG